jgi:mycothiol synthase
MKPSYTNNCCILEGEYMVDYDATGSKITSRAFWDDRDFWRIRELAVETFPTSGLGWNWDIRRWDGSRFYDADPVLPTHWHDSIRLWETEEGRLAGLVNGDGEGWFYLQMHPDYRHLEAEMFAWAEEQLSHPTGEGQHQVATEIYEFDAPRLLLAMERGYAKSEHGTIIRRMWLGQRPLPQIKLADGYTLQSLNGENPEDCQRLADLLNAAFQRSFHNAGELKQFSRLASSFSEDLHLVAAAPDGTFGAHVAVIYDAANRRGLYEPVCTHPEHRRKKLAQALMIECLHRLRAIGAQQVTVETGIMAAANALYDSIGFTEVYRSYAWKKIF